jgi:transposase-like protein
MPKRVHSASFKAKVALEAFRGEKTLSELAVQYGVHPVQISRWKKEFLDRAPEIFSDGSVKSREAELQRELDEAHRQLGQAKVELDWAKKKAEELSSRRAKNGR